MPSASKIIILRADFTIPGARNREADGTSRQEDAKSAFFTLLHDNRPDVLVLDLTRDDERAFEAIRTIRERTLTPILVVHRQDDARVEDLRVYGAAGCVAFLFAIPIGWARVAVRAHTVGQVLAGALVTVAATYAQLVIYLRLL